MIRLEETVEVPGSRENVFRYTSDFTNIEQWDPGVWESRKLSPGPPGPGTEYRLVVSSGPMRIPMTYRVREYDPPRKVVLEGEGEKLHALDTISFEETPSGTRITYTAELSFKGVLGSMETLMTGRLRQVGKDAVEGLRTTLTEQVPVPEQKKRNLFKDRLVAPGLVDFTRFGYRRGRKTWKPVAVPMDGKTVVVTGATSGLGRAAAEKLAGLGARVVIVGRSPEKTEKTRQEIIAETGNGDVDFQIADLGLMGDVRTLARALLDSEKSVHVLINNAGALFNERELTAEGIEKSLAVDLLGPYLLTNLLIPRLKASGPSRIVNVSSGGMYTQRIRVDDLQYETGAYNGSAAYARAKRGLVILTEMWAGMLEREGVTVHAMHPGWADTPGVESSLPGFHRITRRFLRSPMEGADTIVWLAASAQAAESTGRFWLDRQPRTTHVFPGTRETDEERKRLWDELKTISGWKDAS